MLNQRLLQQKKITGIILLIAIAAAVLVFLFCTPVSPLLGDLRAGKSDSPVPAEGVWGVIGFYERSADNNATYCLMITFVTLAAVKIVRTSIMQKNAFPAYESDDKLKSRMDAARGTSAFK